MVKTWVALALLLIGGRIVLRTTIGPKRRRIASEGEAAAHGGAGEERPSAAGGGTTPRPLQTGASRSAVQIEFETLLVDEPIPPELAPPARRARRAARLLIAIVWVSVLLAVGILVLVRVLAAMFGRLGG
jgi:hypothetical protein